MTEGMGYPRQVVYALVLALTTVFAAKALQFVNEENGKRIANPLPEFGGAETFVAWGVIFIFLIALADVPQTGALGAAFGWLILFAIIYTYGIAAAQNLAVLMNAKGATSPHVEPSTSGGAFRTRAT